MRVLSSELIHHFGKKILVQGWLYEKASDDKDNYFLLRDRHGLIQIVNDKVRKKDPLNGLYSGSILSVEGIVSRNGNKKTEFVIEKPKITVDVPVFNNKILNIRNITNQGIWKIQAGIVDSIRFYLKSKNFIEFYSPKLFSPSKSSFNEIFTLDYYGNIAGLAQTAQFYKQIMSGTFERVFTIGPTFRKEKISPRHLTEFTTIDVEMSFINDLDDILILINEMIQYSCKYIWTKYRKELIRLNGTKVAISKRIPQISLKMLHKLFYEETKIKIRDESDPLPEEEMFITTYSKTKWNSEAVFITEFPVTTMKFYDYISEKKSKTIERADLILRGVEILTVRRRENRYPILLKQLKQLGGDPREPIYTYYLDNFKYGMPNHAGFGLGLERLTAQLLGFDDIKKASLFPRDANHLVP